MWNQLKQKTNSMKTGGLVLSIIFGAFGHSQELTLTPAQTAGPFYPGFNQTQQSGDSDLSNNFTAHGTPIVIKAKVSNKAGEVIPNALIHIWQTDGIAGRYFNDDRTEALDVNFDYYGKSISQEDGRFSFRTIRPIEYPAGEDWIRPDHIHLRVFVGNQIKLTTQIYFSGDEFLEQDLILQNMSDEERKTVIIDYKKNEELSREQEKTILEGKLHLVID